MKRSDSAAFGRLRIDSPRILTPGPGSIKTSLQRRRQLRIAEYGATVVSNPSENSPFVKIPSGGFQSSGPLALKNVGSPPLQVWIAPALCCAMAYALYNIFIKKGSSHINPVLGGVILQLVAAVLGCGLLTFLLFTQGGSEVIVYDGEGIYWAILAGVAVGSGKYCYE
jgi:drug/metabolite transporter (DMT)-like permease